jgi:hypothetical protein
VQSLIRPSSQCLDSAMQFLLNPVWEGSMKDPGTLFSPALLFSSSH